MWFNIILFTLGYELLDACIPTQNVEGSSSSSALSNSKTTTTTTTTTMTTTTTTTTLTPLSSYPCSCPPVYESGCLTANLLPELCPSAAGAGVHYYIGTLPPPVSTIFGISSFCLVGFACPLGSVFRVKIPNSNLVFPAPGVTLAYCPESGSRANKWYYGASPLEIVGSTCEPISSG